MAARNVGKLAQWKQVQVKSPRQIDNHSCGIFVLMVSLHVSANYLCFCFQLFLTCLLQKFQLR